MAATKEVMTEGCDIATKATTEQTGELVESISEAP
jgi:hypothetical protein